MANILKHFFLIYFLSILGAFAAFVWTPEEGMSAEGGLAEQILGKTLQIRDPRQAMEIGHTEQEAGNLRNALSLYQKVYTDYPNTVYAPEARFEAGKLFMESHQYQDAFNTLEKIITDYPNYSRFNDVIGIQFDIAKKLQSGKRPYYWGIIPGFRDYSKAINYFESIVTNAPYSKYAPMALMNIADLAKAHRKPEDVIDALERLASYYKKDELAPNATLKLAETYMNMVPGSEYDQGATRIAIDYYEDFLILYPEHPLIEDAEIGLIKARDKYARSKLKMGDFYYQYRNNAKAARIFYNETISLAPESQAAEKARNQIEKLDMGILAPKTPFDIVFGRYTPLSTPAYLDELEIEDRAHVEFSTATDEITLGGTSPENKLEDFFIEDPKDPSDDEAPHYDQPFTRDRFLPEDLTEI